MSNTVTFIGAGNMAEALIRGLISCGAVSASQIIATDIRPERLQHLQHTYNVRTDSDNARAAQQAGIIVLAVKPQQMSDVLSALRPPPPALYISIAAGITTAFIERALGGCPRVVRAMPNTPAIVASAATAICKGEFATAGDLDSAESLLRAVGIVVRVPESLMDAVTAVSGSGPAYAFYLAEAMITAAVRSGLSETVARQLTVQTILGAAKLLVGSGESPQQLRKKVTSPGGTTEAAIRILEKNNFSGILGEAISAAVVRSRELAGN